MKLFSGFKGSTENNNFSLGLFDFHKKFVNILSLLPSFPKGFVCNEQGFYSPAA